MSNFWDKQIIVKKIDKNKREQVVFSLCERQDKKYLDVRIHALSKDGDCYVPTSKGFNLETSKAEDIKNAIDMVLTLKI